MVIMGANIPLPAIRAQIASGIDIIIHLGRLRDKSRKVLEIVEVLGYQDGEIILNTLFKFEEDEGESSDKVSGQLVGTGSRLKNRKKLEAAGLTLDNLYEKEG